MVWKFLSLKGTFTSEPPYLSQFHRPVHDAHAIIPGWYVPVIEKLVAPLPCPIHHHVFSQLNMRISVDFFYTSIPTQKHNHFPYGHDIAPQAV